MFNLQKLLKKLVWKLFLPMKAFPTWGNKGWEGIFVGVSKDTPGCWRVLNIRTKQYVDTNHMIANENLSSSMTAEEMVDASISYTHVIQERLGYYQQNQMHSLERLLEK